MPSGWALYKKSSFDEKENKLYNYRGKDCIEKVSKKLKEDVIEMINYKQRDIIPLTQEENNYCNEQEKMFCVDKYDKNYNNRKKLKIIVIIQENLEELHIIFAI